MISIDDHLPPDSSSFHSQNHHYQQQISHDIKINRDEKAPPSVSDIHLLKSPAADVDDTNKPLPSFSIRDYVFTHRNKDVGCNWPFSHKNLQLCVMHGVKNLLPPFQPLDFMSDSSFLSRCIVEKNLRPDEEIVSSFEGKSMDGQFKLVSCDGAKSNQELSLESGSTNCSGLRGDKESESHLEENITHIKSKKIPLTSSQNTSTQTAMKKRRLIMALNSDVEPIEEVTPNNLIVSKTMASKVCPVCKTFSASSNTTLNAHIDRCLLGESSVSMKWTSKNPNVLVKPRMKPRKTRLMVDIYKTTPHCSTVEELDRRNGTSWAINSSYPSEGTVYIDTNGTKVRILSAPKVGASDDHGAWNLLKAGKGTKTVDCKNKNKLHE